MDMETIIKKNQFREMPWKNGLGVTQEIDIHPYHADFTKSDFHWRLSSALVKTENYFSPFPGYDRLLIVIDGKGLKLNGNVLPPLTVYSFSGDEKIECSLVDGDVTDLGIIFKRDLYKCDMHLVTLTQNAKTFFDNGVHYIKCISGCIKIDGIILEAEEFLKIEGSEIADVEPQESPAQFLKISIRLKNT